MTTALYRRYRPDTFAEMIGQEHVTGPLMQALRSGRVNHAYLFSGPRGCGKTTSARILARTLNCHRNTPDSPVDTPCGECPSCTELARGGPGSLDVVEIDAASHNGVDDARDLRERATFAPARDRFKIFILDEAHMVTPQGFNALLKIVEEPPPHIKFVFATTEPDKVIGTIRSRTHHYPFRLVPPDVLSPYLTKLCDAEGIEIGQGVLPLVTRAGGGSVRDTLSVLDQLIAGASADGVGYDLAVGLLGYTHASLLDDVVDALAVRDGASIFRVVDQIIATGHEPRRFVEDVLERLRDLIVIGVSGEAADAVLRELPADQLERMRAQAGRIGIAELSRAADLVNSALTEMTGATSPRLHLELLCARLLLPGSDDGAAGLAARIDRLERGGIAQAAGSGGGADVGGRGGSEPVAAGDVGQGLSGAAAARAVVEAGRARKSGGGAGNPSDAGGMRSGGAEGSGPAAEASNASRGVTPDGGSHAGEASGEPSSAASRSSQSAAAQPVAAPAEPTAESGAGGDAGRRNRETAQVGTPASGSGGSGSMLSAEEVRRRWPEVLETLSAARVTWSLVGQNAQVATLDGGVLRLAFRAEGLARAFSNPRHTKAVEEAVYQTLGLQVSVEGIVGDGGPGRDASGEDGAGPGRGGSGPGGPGPASGNSEGDTPGQAGVQHPASGQAPADPATSAPDAPPAETSGWPDVVSPGGPRMSVQSPAGSDPTHGPGGRGADTTRSAVALAERPVSTTARTASTPPARRPEAGSGTEQDPVSDEPPLAEPPSDYDEDLDPAPAPSRRSAVAGAGHTGSGHAGSGHTSAGRPGVGHAGAGHTRTDTPGTGDAGLSDPPTPEASYATPEPTHLTGAARAREALRRAQEGRRPTPQGGTSGTTGTSDAVVPGAGTASAERPEVTYDELSADDPNIDAGAGGLAGVPLVVKILGGTVIDEQVDQHM